MNKLLLFGLIIIFQFACSENTSPKNQSSGENSEKVSQEQLEKNQVIHDNKRQDSINALLDGLSVQFFEHSGGTYDMEGWCIDGGRLTQIKNFDNSKTYVCSKGSYIQKVVVLGTCKNLNLQFFNENDEIVENLKGFTLVDKVVFETEYVHNPGSGTCEEKKGSNYKAWFRNVTKMTIAYGDSVFYSANWKSSTQRWKQP